MVYYELHSMKVFGCNHYSDNVIHIFTFRKFKKKKKVCVFVKNKLFTRVENFLEP